MTRREVPCFTPRDRLFKGNCPFVLYLSTILTKQSDEIALTSHKDKGGGQGLIPYGYLRHDSSQCLGCIMILFDLMKTKSPILQIIEFFEVKWSCFGKW